LRAYAIAIPKNWTPDLNNPGTTSAAGVPEIYYCEEWMKKRDEERQQAGKNVGLGEIIDGLKENKDEIKKQAAQNRDEIKKNRDEIMKNREATKNAVRMMFAHHDMNTPRTFVILSVPVGQVAATVNFLGGVMDVVSGAAGMVEKSTGVVEHAKTALKQPLKAIKDIFQKKWVTSSSLWRRKCTCTSSTKKLAPRLFAMPLICTPSRLLSAKATPMARRWYRN